MASQNPNPKPLYPKIDPSNPNPNPNPNSSSSSLYPSLDMSDLVNDLFPDDYHHPIPNPNPSSGPEPPSAPLQSDPIQETLLTVPGAVVHLIDQNCSVELSVGDFSVVRIRDGDNLVAVLLRVSDEVQWPLMKDEVVVKLDDSHYFFSFPDSTEDGGSSSGGGGGGGGVEVLNYGLSFATKGQEDTLSVLDEIFRTYGNFTEQRVSEGSRGEVAGVGLTEDLTPVEVKTDKKKREMMERNCGAYWTTLAPNVEEYSGTAAKLIASGSGKLIQGILWCGDVTSDRLHWGHEVLKKRLDPCLDKKEIDQSTLKRIRRVKRTTKMTNKVAEGVLSGVVRVSGFVTSSVVNSKAGKKFFSLLPGEVILASLDGFNRICDAVEVAGKNVMSTSSTVTTGLVTHKYGEEAGKVTNEGLGAAGHAIGTAWTVFKIRKALNPKSSVKPTSLAKSALKAAATDYKSQKSTKK